MSGEDDSGENMARTITTESAAMRLARTIASDILLYNREKVLEGLKNDDLFPRLSEELDEGQRHFIERTTPEIRETLNYVERAFVDLIAQRFADEPTTCW